MSNEKREQYQTLLKNWQTEDKELMWEILSESLGKAPLTEVKEAAREAKNTNQELMSITRMKQATLADILAEQKDQTKHLKTIAEHLGKIAAKAEATGYITTTVG